MAGGERPSCGSSRRGPGGLRLGSHGSDALQYGIQQAHSPPSGYFLEEYGRVVGLGVESKVTRSTAKGDPLCEWELVLERNATTEAYVASLPPLPPSVG